MNVKNKKKIGIISAVLILVLIAGGATYYKVQQDKIDNSISKLKANQKVQEEILSEIKNGWDEEDNNYVSADLIKDTLEDLDKKISTQTEELQNFKGNSNKEIASLSSEQSKILIDIKDEQQKLTEAFDYTNSINDLFEEKVIIGSQVKNDGHIKTDADLSDLEKQLNGSETLNTPLKETISSLIIIGNEQIKENTGLQTKVKEISADRKLKEDVTIEDLNSFNSYISKLKYPFLKDEHKKIIDEIPSKIESLSPKASKLSDNEINRRIIAWFSDGHTIKTVNGNQISVYPLAEIGWIDVAGTKIFTTGIYVSAEEIWNIELTEEGNAYSVRYNASYVPGSIFTGGTSGFNIFDITDEQLSQVREDVSKPYNP